MSLIKMFGLLGSGLLLANSQQALVPTNQTSSLIKDKFDWQSQGSCLPVHMTPTASFAQQQLGNSHFSLMLSDSGKKYEPMDPLNSALEEENISKVKSIVKGLQKFENLFNCDFECADTLVSTVMDLRIMSHVWEVNPTATIKGISTRFFGSTFGKMAKNMLEMIRAFFLENPSLVSIKQQSELESVLLNASLSVHGTYTAEKALLDFQRGKPVILYSGFHGHSINIVLYKSYLVITNKGAGSSRPIEAYRINPTKITKQYINDVKNLGNLPSEDFYKNFGSKSSARTDAVLLNKVEATPSKGLLSLLEARYDPKDFQLMGNCVWESLETALHVVMVLQQAEADSHNNDVLTTCARCQDTLDKRSVFIERKRKMETCGTCYDTLDKGSRLFDRWLEFAHIYTLEKGISRFDHIEREDWKGVSTLFEGARNVGEYTVQLCSLDNTQHYLTNRLPISGGGPRPCSNYFKQKIKELGGKIDALHIKHAPSFLEKVKGLF